MKTWLIGAAAATVTAVSLWSGLRSGRLDGGHLFCAATFFGVLAGYGKHRFDEWILGPQPQRRGSIR